MAPETTLRCPETLDAVTSRLRAAVAEPFGTGLDDAMNLHFTARPGEPPLVGRLEDHLVTVWRRGAGQWVGVSRFGGQLRASGSGTELTGMVRLRWIGRLGNALLLVGATVGIALVAWLQGWKAAAGEAVLWAAFGTYAILVQVRDRRLLLQVLNDIVGGIPTAP